MPKVLSRVDLKEATDFLRYHYFENVKGIQKMCSINTLLTKFLNDVQDSRFETFIITLASAYYGYQFYLPAFLDFRGRIYRSGVLHFHERDLAKSLIRFGPISVKKCPQLRHDIACAAAFKYQKFTSLSDAYQWYQSHVENSDVLGTDQSFIQFSQRASVPFQFIAKTISLSAASNRLRATLRVSTDIRDTRKTMKSTCVNVIHQRDAYIAMQVVKRLLEKKAPVYTVHDNFLTIPEYAPIVPNIYIKVFQDMGPPLRIVNSFIRDNIHNNALRLQAATADEGNDSMLQIDMDSIDMDVPLPSNLLIDAFELLILPALSKTTSKRKTWDKRVDEAISMYQQYCRTVCDDEAYQNKEDGGKSGHAEKWKLFHDELDKWRSKPFNYSVHY
ncbi:hypothetical protein LUZ60_004549 [Juncus effusus]|nr:hypothetical protein LUZ60_004549 [Juncus effusus]